MSRCPSCDYWLPRDREYLGARCPNCREPLYEAAGRLSQFVQEGDGACALHPDREPVGTCGHCGDYICLVCRTRWRKSVYCVVCVEHALAERQATPEQTRAHARQAILGVLLGVGAWSAFLGVVLTAVAVNAFEAPILVLLIFLLFPASLVMGILGLGQSTAALRRRGPHLIAAAGGLIVSGLFLGAVIGFFVFPLWFS